MSDDQAIIAPIVEVAVSAEWRPYWLGGHWWRLVFVDPCPNCNARHRHGGGNHPEGPLLGDRSPHCAGAHHPFREDCQRGRNCRIEHIGGYVLVAAE